MDIIWMALLALGPVALLAARAAQNKAAHRGVVQVEVVAKGHRHRQG